MGNEHAVYQTSKSPGPISSQRDGLLEFLSLRQRSDGVRPNLSLQAMYTIHLRLLTIGQYLALHAMQGRENVSALLCAVVGGKDVGV